jgi:hypothetical protein
MMSLRTPSEKFLASPSVLLASSSRVGVSGELRDCSGIETKGEYEADEEKDVGLWLTGLPDGKTGLWERGLGRMGKEMDR